MRRLRRSVALTLAALLVVSNAALWQRHGPSLRTEDRNHDGRPDVWRWYDADGRLVRLELDTNFDGRPDAREAYRDDRPIRVEIDTNLDNRIDRVVEFDPQTHDVIREEIDTNLNGTADVLLLYEHGRPVFVEHVVDDVAAAEPEEPDALLAFNDPFLNDLAVRSTFTRLDPVIAVLASAGAPQQLVRISAPRTGRSIARCSLSPVRTIHRRSILVRGPPLVHSL